MHLNADFCKMILKPAKILPHILDFTDWKHRRLIIIVDLLNPEDTPLICKIFCLVIWTPQQMICQM